MAKSFRKAVQKDLLDIIRLLAEDELGSGRESSNMTPSYQMAFDEINADPNQALMVVEENDQVIGICHLTFMPSLTFQGSKRMNIEAVRVNKSSRNHGVGEWMIQQAIAMAKENGCKIIQLTTDKQHTDAKRFYEKLGFEASHEGMKLFIDSSSLNNTPNKKFSASLRKINKEYGHSLKRLAE